MATQYKPGQSVKVPAEFFDGYYDGHYDLALVGNEMLNGLIVCEAEPVIESGININDACYIVRIFTGEEQVVCSDFFTN